ncbi:DnaD domain-containing protein [Bacillaceae bacterium Marseille-Q3522]|nr:DnaD domain-containing protein [Bacillaceae bacterium Marseille-Q3522]
MSKMAMIKWIQEGTISIPNLLLTQYRNLHLHEVELVLLMQLLSFAEKGNAFPTPEQLSSVMNISPEECAEYLRKLIQRGFIEIVDAKEGIGFEKYSLIPLWERLAERFLRIEQHEKEQTFEKETGELYRCFEQEFGRPLSPLESETLMMWLDEDFHDTTIIKAALREAVLSGKLNFRYIDRILFEWKKNGIKTIEQAKIHSLKFRQNKKQQNRSPGEKANPEIPFYNWLEQ